MAAATFLIDGMHCVACAMRNERTLRKIPGVLKAEVDLRTRRARVTFDGSTVSEAALHQAVTGNGYEVLAEDSGRAGSNRSSDR